jgi:predicted MFS family arabinose efflux permease
MNTAPDSGARPYLALGALAAGAFVVGMDMLAAIGALNETAHGLAVSPRQAGWIISVYAIFYALFAPANALLFRRNGRRSLLLLAMALSIAGNLICSVATGLPEILVGRLISAFGGAMFLPTAGTVAKDVISADQKGRALACLYAGITLAQAVGAPITTLAAQLAGWRYSFVAVALSGCMAMALLVSGTKTLPSVRASPLSASVWQPNTAIPIAGMLATTCLVTIAEYVVYSYISVIFEPARLGDRPALPVILAAFGCGGIIGTIVTGLLTDKLGPRLVLMTAVTVQTALFVIIMLWRESAPATILLGFCWGITSYMYVVPIQHGLLDRAGTHQRLVLALNGSLLNAGIAAGTTIGGLTIDHGDMPLTAIVAASISAAAFAAGAVFVPGRRAVGDTPTPGQTIKAG